MAISDNWVGACWVMVKQNLILHITMPDLCTIDGRNDNSGAGSNRADNIFSVAD